MLTPENYKDPTKETMLNGRPMADAVRGGAKGIKGVIVAPAGVDGRPSNFDPHDRSGIVITVEPDNNGGQPIPLSALTKDAVQQAIDRANSQISGNDINAVRERTALAFEELAKLAGTGIVAKGAASRPSPQPAAPPSDGAPPPRPPRVADIPPPDDGEPEPTQAMPPVEQIDRSYSPMAAFGLKTAPRHSPPTSSGAHRGHERAAAAPNKLLYFEKEGIGTVPAFFHDVVIDVNFDDDAMVETGFIVLVYDLLYPQATARWFPPANDPYQRPWALQINNDRRLYLVQTTGFQYVYDDREFCVLAVEKAVTAEN